MSLIFDSLHLFELDETFVTADGSTAVLPLQYEMFVDTDGEADITGHQGQVVDLVVADEAGVTADSEFQAIQGAPEFTLTMTKEHVREMFRDQKKRFVVIMIIVRLSDVLYFHSLKISR